MNIVSPSHTFPSSQQKKNRWLITGGCGFIGTNLIRSLLDEDDNYYIRILDNLSVGDRDNLTQVCEFRESTSPQSDGSSQVDLLLGDIRDYSICLKSCCDIDTVVHLAANAGVENSVENPRKDMETNVIGTFNMLEAAKQNKVKRFIFASSNAPVGFCKPPIHEELPPHPISPYGSSKLAGEAYCSSFFHTYGIKTIILRFSNVYGPRSIHKNSVIAKFIKQVLIGKPLELYGDGRQTRDYIYIDDLIHAIRRTADFRTDSKIGLSLRSKASIGNETSDNTGQGGFIRESELSLPWGEIFQIASNHETSLNMLVEKLLFNLKNFGFSDIRLINSESRIGDMKFNFSDTSKVNELFGWKAKISLDEGIKMTVKWFLEKFH